MSKLARTPVETVGAGRTDAGVHALAQVMSGRVPDGFDLDRAQTALNSMLGPAIAVRSVLAVADDFNARFSARSRTYVYAIHSSPVHDPFLAATSWHRHEPLDVDAMQEAAGHLLGEHDFRSFGRAEGDAGAIRTLFELECTSTGRIVRIRARANAFIQQMVRSLVGTLVEVGLGKRPSDSMPAILQARDRAAAGPVAPPQGLCLVSVEYDEGWSVPEASA